MELDDRQMKQKDLVERVGLFFEDNDFSPITARILSLLMVMDKQQFTFEEIVDSLQISKSSASTAIQLLLSRKLIEYTTIPCDRKRYFRIKQHSKFNFIDEIEDKMNRMSDLLAQIIELRLDKNSDNTLQIMSMLKINRIICRYINDLKNEVKGFEL